MCGYEIEQHWIDGRPPPGGNFPADHGPMYTSTSGPLSADALTATIAEYKQVITDYLATNGTVRCYKFKGLSHDNIGAWPGAIPMRFAIDEMIAAGTIVVDAERDTVRLA